MNYLCERCGGPVITFGNPGQVFAKCPCGWSGWPKPEPQVSHEELCPYCSFRLKPYGDYVRCDFCGYTSEELEAVVEAQPLTVSDVLGQKWTRRQRLKLITKLSSRL